MSQASKHEHLETNRRIRWMRTSIVLLTLLSWQTIRGAGSLAWAREQLPAVDEAGCPRAPYIDQLDGAGSALQITVGTPVRELPHEDIWVVQHSSNGTIVGEVLLTPDQDLTTTVSIPNGIRAALDLGPAFTLSILDSDRLPIGEPVPFVVKLVCGEVGTCQLVPSLGVAPGGSLSISPELAQAIDDLIAFGYSISLESIRMYFPQLESDYLDMLWQRGFRFHADICACDWLSSHTSAGTTGGVHLLNVELLPGANGNVIEQIDGTTNVRIQLLCTQPGDSVALLREVLAGDSVSVQILDNLGFACSAPCAPRVTHKLVYQARGNIGALGPSPPSPDPGSVIGNRIDWFVSPSTPTAPLEEVITRLDDIEPSAFTLWQPASTTLHQDSTSHFSGCTILDLDVTKSSSFASTLDMVAESQTCEATPLAFVLERRPRFVQNDRCDVERHTSLRIGTGL